MLFFKEKVMKIEEVMSVLNGLSIDEELTIRERAAINEALMAMSNIIYKKEDQTDFQGWPVKKLTMKDLRKFVRDNGPLDDTVKILVLEDDGMGYGARNGYCSDIYVGENEIKEKEVQIWF
jgi:hypothetical protein